MTTPEDTRFQSEAHEVLWLHAGEQRLGLLPTLGGAVAAWQCGTPQGMVNLWRPWDGGTDLYRCASFAMVPWSNRISGGSFESAPGRFHAMQPNRQGEPYPIHGDGWLQPWQVAEHGPAHATLVLTSFEHGGNPHHYEATQRFALDAEGLDQVLTVRHLGTEPLPYGLGVHPWFERTPRTRLQAPVQGVWLSGDDPIPTGYSTQLPDDWNLSAGIDAHGSFIDNAFGGWAGTARIEWPERGIALALHMPGFDPGAAADARCCLVYRPPQGDAFCFEPITHPIDAFHLPGRPGLRLLQPGDSLSLRMRWSVHAL
ncbi:MAG: aldose 1-epimerase [Aquincola tertiaricarbonis]